MQNKPYDPTTVKHRLSRLQPMPWWRALLITAGLFMLALMLLLILLYHSLELNLTAFYERSRTYNAADGTLLSYTPTKEGRLRFLTSPQSVDPLLIKLLLSSEDERFYAHGGVDFIAIARAAVSNLLAGRRISGASTLDMQCIRLLNKRPRTYKNKIIEAILAVKLRRTLGADGVLQLYLTLAPMGSRLEGIRAGSLAWFGREPNHLSPAQAALLSALPRAPELLRPDRNPQRARFYVHEVLRRAQENGLISAKLTQAALNEPLPTHIRKIKEPGFYLKHYATTKLRDVPTTIDHDIQRRLLNVAATFNRQATSQDEDLAIVVIDDVTHQIVGLLGGRCPNINELDLTQAIRSPGSSLKPFAYALAIERKLLHPLTLMADEGSGFNTYQPLNFERTYSGFVSAQEALVRSLNVPAVKILQALGPQVLLRSLNRGQTRIYLPSGAEATLPLILGGCGVKLYDLTTLYSMLNTKGQLYQPKLIKSDKAPKVLRMLAPKAAAQTLMMLQKNPPPDGFIFSQGRFAYKTGTSHNYADALALGSNGRYSIGVWVGKRSGRSNYPHTGRERAAPILFTLLSELATPASSYPQNDLSAQIIAHLTPESAPPPYLTFFAPADKKLFATAHSGALPNRDLRIIFPQDKMILYAVADEPLIIEAQGGSAPYLLYVNDKLQANLSFIPPTVPGFYHLTVVDSKGASASITIKVVGSLN